MPAAPTDYLVQPPAQGPFSAYLNPLAPPTQTPPATGWETHPHAVVGAEIATGVLDSIRRNRIMQAAQTEHNNDLAFQNYRQTVQGMLANPDLTDEGRQAIQSAANAVMANHTQYEAKDLPKDGVGGFLKNALITMTGGPIKQRQPIDFDKEVGNITKLAGAGNPNSGVSFSQTSNYNKALQAASQKIAELKGPNGTNPVLPDDFKREMAPYFNMVAQTAPSKIPQFQAVVESLVPQDPYASARERARLEVLQRVFPGSSPTQPPPGATAASPMPSPVAAGAPPPGGTSEIPAAAAAPQTIPPPVGPATPPELATVGTQFATPNTPAPAAAATTPPPPAAGFNIRDPMIAGVLQDITGTKLGPAETLYNPNLQDPHHAVANAMWDPYLGKYVDAQGKPLPDDEQNWIPSTQFKPPTLPGRRIISGSPTPGGNPIVMIADEHGGPAKPLLDSAGHVIYGSVPLEPVEGPTGPTRVPRESAINAPIPPPPEQADVKAERARLTAATALFGDARTAFPGDPDKQQDYIAHQNVPADVRGEAYHMLGREPTQGGELGQLYNKLMNQGKSAAGAPATGTPPAGAAAAPKAATTAAPAKALTKEEQDALKKKAAALRKQ